MTYLLNDPATFAEEAVEGFVAAHRSHVRPVRGGVLRAQPSPSGEVAVVIGGGSGHYPAFGGYVGVGLAHGAVLGNVFASPSAGQVTSVASAAHRGAGVLLSYGNYAGDVLHFTEAARRLRAEGIEVETVAVTDDIASAPAGREYDRRGVAGDLVVFKCAAAAAAAGHPLAAVADIARRANDRTRSLGVALSGCSLPGAAAPLFTVATGRMAVGMGIHGEPGLSEVDLPTAAELGELLLSQLLADSPQNSADGARVVVIVNGLGAVKGEELFVLYRTVEQHLRQAGVVVVEAVVGELVTSFEMAGVSLTLAWLDEELEQLWSASVNAPAFRRDELIARSQDHPGGEGSEDFEPISPASEVSRRAAGNVLEVLRAAAATINEHAERLGAIDAVAGDGDHGVGMQRGVNAALAAAEDAQARGAGAGTLLARASVAWSDRAGGTSGALWEVILDALGQALGDQTPCTPAAVREGVDAATTAVRRFGADVGDKTLVDALVPFADTLAQAINAGVDLPAAWAQAAAAAQSAATATAGLMPGLGRARTHGQRSLGTPDAGAISLALIADAAARVLAELPEPVSGLRASHTTSATSANPASQHAPEGNNDGSQA